VRSFFLFALPAHHFDQFNQKRKIAAIMAAVTCLTAAAATHVTRLQQVLDEADEEEREMLLYDVNRTVWVRPRRNSARRHTVLCVESKRLASKHIYCTSQFFLTSFHNVAHSVDQSTARQDRLGFICFHNAVSE
jgi:hypothetical protein